MSGLTNAHIASQSRLRAIVEQLVTTAWTTLPAYNEPDVDPFLAQVVPVVLAAQRQSAALTDAYLARALERQPLGIPAALVTGAALRAGSQPQDVYRRPFVTVWTALAAGAQWQDATAAGLARAQSMAAMDVQLASRATFAQVQERDTTIFGYQRRADPGACPFCVLVDGAYVKSADAMPLHNRCGCSLEPLTGAHRLAVELPDGTRIRDFQGGPLTSTPPPAQVAVEQHGELGPLLVDPSQHFAQV